MRNKGKCRLFRCLAILCAGLSIILGAKVYIKLRSYKSGEADLERVRAVYTSAIMDRESKMTAFRKLREQNGDFTGWIRIGGTAIDYPVMRAPQEPDFYLDHGFDKKPSVYGSIYMDGICRADGTCRNIILYGHHMRNGAMFGSLEQYNSEEYFKKHRRIVFEVLCEDREHEDREHGDRECEDRERETGHVDIGEYEIIAVLRSTEKETKKIQHCLSAESKEDYKTFISFCKDRSLYDTGGSADWPEQLLTLATCEYTQKNGRLFLVAKRVAPEHAEVGD